MGVVLAVVIVISLFWVIGYVKCIIKVCRCQWVTVGKPEIIYTLALITGLAGIVGYINIK